MGQLRDLDRRVLPEGRDPALLYDAPVPGWLRHPWWLSLVLTPLTVGLVQSDRLWLAITAFAVVTGTYAALAAAWARKHRRRSSGQAPDQA